MAKGYRPVLRDQPFLLPVDMREWLPAGHLVWFVLDVVEQLDTSAFRHRRVKAASGRAGFELVQKAVTAGIGCVRSTSRFG